MFNKLIYQTYTNNYDRTSGLSGYLLVRVAGIICFYYSFKLPVLLKNTYLLHTVCFFILFLIKQKNTSVIFRSAMSHWGYCYIIYIICRLFKYSLHVQ